MDSFSIMALAFGVGAAIGALSAFLGWNKTNEPFDSKKFVSGVVTGILSGLALVLMQQAQIISWKEPVEVLVGLVTISLAILGVDTVRTSITGAATKDRNNNAITEQPAEQPANNTMDSTIRY